MHKLWQPVRKKPSTPFLLPEVLGRKVVGAYKAKRMRSRRRRVSFWARNNNRNKYRTHFVRK